MSSAFYPLGMNSYNNRLPHGGYVPWKGDGVFSNPVGITSSNIRPLTNLDPGNVFQTGFGLARPIKHYRKGRVVPHYTSVLTKDERNNTSIGTAEQLQIQYNTNRMVKSSYGASLSGGSGGMGILNQMIDRPGAFIVKENTPAEKSNREKMTADCNTCQGFGIVASYYPNNRYLTENPDIITTTRPLCCNEERKAVRRVLPASTNLKKNYYTTLQTYRQNRCQTYDQRIFNFQTVDPMVASNVEGAEVTAVTSFASKPGSPLALISNTYVANCYPNSEIRSASVLDLVERLLNILKQQSILTESEINNFLSENQTPTLDILLNYLTGLDETNRNNALSTYNAFILNPYYGVPIEGPTNARGCKLVVYKPNNYQYAQQGAVSSSTRTFKLDVNTIETNAASFRKFSATNSIDTGNAGSIPINPFILKQKHATCNNPPIFPFQNKKACAVTLPTSLTNLPVRWPFPSNKYHQSPNSHTLL
jgi:hypothetical protein